MEENVLCTETDADDTCNLCVSRDCPLHEEPCRSCLDEWVHTKAEVGPRFTPRKGFVVTPMIPDGALG